jgi:hypothetical protein
MGFLHSQYQDCIASNSRISGEDFIGRDMKETTFETFSQNSRCSGNSLFSTSSRPGLGPTQRPIQWAQGPISPGVKRQGFEVDHSPPTSAEGKENMDLYIHSPIHLDDIVLNC